MLKFPGSRARGSRVAALLVAVTAIVGLVPEAGGATNQPMQTLVFDAVGRETSFVDQPPTGPSPGDTENITARLRDATGHFVGTAKSTCVFTQLVQNDVLERCSASGTTRAGTVTFGGVGHLESMNPPWPIISGTGAYKGVQGTLVYESDIPLDPNVPLVAGRLFSVAVFEVQTSRPLGVGVVPRPASNASFIRRADAACHAVESKSAASPQFPFSNFDPFHPDKTVLPQVGQFFDQPARRRLPMDLLASLDKLGQPPADGPAWRKVLAARQAVLANEHAQIKAALANDAAAFVRTVYGQSRLYNQLVFNSAVFGVQSCTFT